MATKFTLKGGALPLDSGLIPVQANTGFETEDSANANESPLTVSSTAKTIAIPDYATHAFFFAIDADCRIGPSTSDLSGSTPNSYFVLVAGIWSPPVPCADGNSIKALRDATTDVKLSYYFAHLQKA